MAAVPVYATVCAVPVVLQTETDTGLLCELPYLKHNNWQDAVAFMQFKLSAKLAFFTGL